MSAASGPDRIERPPAWAVWVARGLSALMPSEERDFVIGDLDEGFHARRERRGRALATGWYLTEAVRSTWPLLTLKLRLGWREGMMIGLEKDLRFALGVFRRSRGFAAVVVLTLAVGVGATTAVYSVIRGVLLSPLAFDHADRVVMLWGQTPDYPRMPLTVGDFNALAEGVDAFEETTAGWGNNALILGDGEPEQVSVGWVTPEYFDVLGVRPALGRGLLEGDAWAIVLSHDLWVRRHGADPSVVGRTVELPGGTFEIVGVLPADRDPNLPAFGGGLSDYDVWRLQPPEWMQGEDRSVGWLRASARLRDGVSVAQAQAEVDALVARVNETVTERDGGTDFRVNLVAVRQDLVGGLSRTLWILFAAVCGVLLIAASNVAHLTLARGEGRAGEVALRAALGGSRARLIRQLLVESGVLAAVGGIVGFGVAWVAVRSLVAIAPATLPRLDAVAVDPEVFLFALAATGTAALVFGLVPALRATRTDLAGALGDRTATATRAGMRLSRALVVAEVAVSLMLLTATGLLLRSLSGLRGVDLGFETEGIVTFALEAPRWGDTAEEAAATTSAYLESIRSVPGVRAAGFTNRVPLGGGLFSGTYRSDDMVAADADALEASFRYVTPGYLEAMGARLVAGRALRPEDGAGTVVVDELAARRLWPNGDPVGRRVQISTVAQEDLWAEVVGVIAPMKHAGVAKPAEETVLLPMLAFAHEQNFHYAAVRVSGAPLAFVEPLKEALRAVDGNAVIARVRTMRDLFDQDVAATRFASLLLSLFGAVALTLATVGLHGVMAYTMRRRTREIGIRVALGARRGSLLRKAVGSGAILVAGGMALGLLLSMGVGRVLQSVLFEVRPTDPVSLAGAAATILAVGLLGAWLPARLVLSMDPAKTLRQE